MLKELKTNERVVVTNATSEMINVYRDVLNKLCKMENIYLSQFVSPSGECDEISKICEILRDFLGDYLLDSLINNNCESI